MIFKSRYYNKIEEVPRGIRKISSNIKKLSQEIEFYKSLSKSPALKIKHYFPRLIDWEHKNNEISYITENCGRYTASDDFVNNFFDAEYDIEDLLDLCFKFIRERPTKQESSDKSCEFLYKNKVSERYQEFLNNDLSNKMATGRWYYFYKEYRSLINRYLKLIENLKSCDHTAFHHGDFCLTNMFAEFNSLKLIDPMGLENEFNNFHDPLYDVAKLSHSILGNYDRIINDQFFIELTDSGFELKIDPNYTNNYNNELFIKLLKENNFDYYQVRLREASLFLSMIPLHPEKLTRVSAFILQARNILDELESIDNI